MSAATPIRRAVSNEGGFFSPYYLFDLMVRAHADELDLDGRDRERRMLPRVYRRAMARLDEASTFGDVWREWYRELFQALGLETQALLDGIITPRHDRVPVSHVAIAPGGKPLALLDLHPIATDLDRDRYDRKRTRFDDLTREPIARAFELALDAQEAPWGLLSNGTELRLYRRGGAVARQFLRVDFTLLCEAGREEEWTAFWGLLRGQALLPDEAGKSLVDRVLEESQRHASKIAEDLRENVVGAVEALVQGVFDERENAAIWGGGQPDQTALARLFEESLYFLYRLLFALYAESRDILPVGESRAYRDAYSVEHLRDLAERELHADDAGKTYYQETLRTLFRLLRQGFRCAEFEIPALGGRGPEDPEWERLRNDGDPHLTSLFDGRRTSWLDRCRIPDRALRTVVRELSLSRPRRRTDQRERYSYADLGVDQLGSIYEGLLVYEPTILTEDTVLVKVAGEIRVMGRNDAESNDLPIVEGSERALGSFMLRIWGGRRKGSGAYYTPEEITAFLARQALEPLVEPIFARCAEACAAEQERAREAGELPLPRTRIAEEILELRVCDPAMGSGGFLIQACRYLAEAYGQALVAEGRDDSARIEPTELARFKRQIAELCLYGVDLNPLAVELTKVSIWLETLARGKPLSFLDSHLRCGNSLIGAPLRDADARFTVDGIATIPNEALKLVMKEATDRQKAETGSLIARNRTYLRALERERSGSTTIALFGLDERMLRAALEAYVKSRKALAASDADQSDAEALRLREDKERQFRESYEAADAPVHRLKEVCDLWCAAWFWPEEEGVPAFDSETYRDVVARLLRGEAVAAPWVQIARRSACEQRFLHWELEFPEIFLRDNPGFDAMVGNPPWEKVSGDMGGLAGEYDPLLKTLRGAERDARLDEIIADPIDGPVIAKHARSRGQYARFGRGGPLFAGLIAGELNTFAPFTVLCWKLHRRGGAMAVVLKDAFHLTESLGPVRAAILSHGRIQLLATADNERKVFDAHNQLRFDLLIAARGDTSRGVPISVHRFRTAREIVEHAGETAEVPLELLRDGDGRYSEPIPEILDPWWPRLFEKARQASAGSARVSWGAELHSSADKDLWVRGEKPKQTPGPVLAMVGAFDALAYEPLAWLKPNACDQPAFHKVIWNGWRVGVRKRANQKDERVLIAALIPPRFATCDYLQTTREPIDPRGAARCAALANSLLLDFLLRPAVGSNMQQGILERLPWAVPVNEVPARHLEQDVVALTCRRAEYGGLPRALAISRFTPAVSPEQRALCRARVDAAVARLYGLSVLEFAHILGWFRLLDQDQPPLTGENKSFITRDLALLEFFRLVAEPPPSDIVAFYRIAEVDIAPMTGSIRDLEQRVRAARELGAVAYQPSSRGETGSDTEHVDGDDELAPVRERTRRTVASSSPSGPGAVSGARRRRR